MFRNIVQGSALRELIVLVLFVKIDIGKEKIESYDAVSQAFPSFFHTFVKYYKTRLPSNGKAKQRSQKLAELMEDEDIIRLLKLLVPAPAEWTLVLSGANPKPHGPGEVIELD